MTASHRFPHRAAPPLALILLAALPAWSATSTPTRPQLSSSEQGSYVVASFLGSWSPAAVGAALPGV